MGRPKDQRILHVPRRFSQEEWGGTESVILNFCRQQQAMGLVPEIHTSQALCKVRRETWRDIPIFRYRYCYPFLGLTPEDRAALDKKGGNLLSTELFWKLLFRPDVRIYHAHVLKRMGGAVYRAARLRRKPFVVSLHGNVFDVPKDESDPSQRRKRDILSGVKRSACSSAVDSCWIRPMLSSVSGTPSTKLPARPCHTTGSTTSRTESISVILSLMAGMSAANAWVFRREHFSSAASAA